MFCPNCGQQQATEQMRFCSRCGFPLGLVSEILANGGFLPQLAAINDKKKLLTRRKVFLFGLIWFVIFTFLLVPLTAVLFGDDRAGEVIIPFAAIIGTMGGLLLMLFSLFFESEKKQAQIPLQQQNFIPQNQVGAQPVQNALPPQAANFTPTSNAYQPPRGGWREAKTGELVPPSITEGTTRLLEKDE
ncbi:MAG: zinc ribbon domain-containing protein [Acidobacteriota bacterium]|nr:zinc ribbon domain-containing protein [Acidobacteriota bacterium]